MTTLGAIPFRSKKEKLRRAERASRVAESELERERTAREAAEKRIGEAEKRVKQARASASHAAQRLEKHRTGRRHAKKSKSKSTTMADIVAAAQPIVRESVENAKQASSDAVVRGRKAARRARKATEHAAKSAQSAITPHAEHAKERASEIVDQLTSS